MGLTIYQINLPSSGNNLIIISFRQVTVRQHLKSSHFHRMLTYSGGLEVYLCECAYWRPFSRRYIGSVHFIAMNATSRNVLCSPLTSGFLSSPPFFMSCNIIGVTLWSSKRHHRARWPQKSSALAKLVRSWGYRLLL